MTLRLQVRPPTGPAFEVSHAGPRIRIGRDPNCELVFDHAGQDNVSWEHAQITLTNHAVSLTDVGSTNGTYLNGSTERLKSCALKVGDEFRLGLTGPRIRVLEMYLANGSTVAPPAARRPANYPAAPVVAPRGGVSATRKLLIQSQSRNRTMMALMAGVFMLLIALTSVVVWLTNRNVEGLAHEGKKTQDRVDDVEDKQRALDLAFKDVVVKVDGVAGAMDDFAKKQLEANQQDKQAMKTAVEQAIREAARISAEAQAEMKKLIAQGKKPDPRFEPARDLRDVNRNLGGVEDPGEEELRLVPGMELSIRRKGSGNYNALDYERAALAYAGKDQLELVGFEATRTIKVKYQDIATIYVNEQMYRYNERTKRFEPGISYFRLDQSGNFVRLPKLDDELNGKEWGQTIGERPNKCSIGHTSAGFVIALPKHEYGSSTFPAKSLGEIVTNFGVHKFDEASNRYTFQTHKQIAKIVNDEFEKKKKAERDEEWSKKVQSYKLVTDRIRAARPYWWHWWW